MDSSWLKEDRELTYADQSDAIIATKKALRNSTLITTRLERILNELINESHRDDEDFKKKNWELEAIANASRRKTLRTIIKLLDFK